METGAASGAMERVEFEAWRDDDPVPWAPTGRRYVTVNELLVRLGSFGMGLTWRMRADEDDDWLSGIVKLSEGGVGTLELLALLPSDLQAVNADFADYAGTELIILLREFDSSSWQLATVDPGVLAEIRRSFPDTTPLAAESWEENPWWDEPLPEGWGEQTGRRVVGRACGEAAPLPFEST
ncbi:hypothetical protein [Kitasatospora sp. NPDC058218]|uniref:hypothetical protein n=1 Tax=Kitasatospora sp. NPDC058218 TaxID=3346385 RepID=UPI0036DC40BC